MNMANFTCGDCGTESDDAAYLPDGIGGTYVKCPKCNKVFEFKD